MRGSVGCGGIDPDGDWELKGLMEGRIVVAAAELASRN